MSVVTTYLNDNAQTPLKRFIVDMFYSQLCNKYSDKSNRWSLCLSLWQQRPLSKMRQTVVVHRWSCWSHL